MVDNGLFLLTFRYKPSSEQIISISVDGLEHEDQRTLGYMREFMISSGRNFRIICREYPPGAGDSFYKMSVVHLHNKEEYDDTYGLHGYFSFTLILSLSSLEKITNFTVEPYKGGGE